MVTVTGNTTIHMTEEGLESFYTSGLEYLRSSGNTLIYHADNFSVYVYAYAQNDDLYISGIDFSRYSAGTLALSDLNQNIDDIPDGYYSSRHLWSGDDIFYTTGGGGDHTTIYGLDFNGPSFPDNDVIYAFGGDDIAFVNYSDTVDGGTGEDTAVFEKRYNDYNIDYLGRNNIEVTDKDNPDQTVHLYYVETLLFNDGREVRQNALELDFNQAHAPSTFNEAGYLAANSDVAEAVFDGHFMTGYQHFSLYGSNEGRQGGNYIPFPTPSQSIAIQENALQAQYGGDTIDGDSLDNQIFGSSSVDKLYGFDGADYIAGGSDDDFLHGNRGQDTLRGERGNDTIRGGKETDLLFGSSGDDFLAGDRDNDYIEAGEGDDLVRGGKDNDYIIGHLGNDTIYGDKGNDTMVGNEGFDRFIFKENSGQDIVLDFDAVTDYLVFDGIEKFTTDSDVLDAFDPSTSTIDLGNGNTIYLHEVYTLSNWDVIVY